MSCMDEADYRCLAQCVMKEEIRTEDFTGDETMEKRCLILIEEESGAAFEITKVHEGWYPRPTAEDRAHQAWDSLFTEHEAEAVIAEVMGWVQFKNPRVESITLGSLLRSGRLLNIQKQLGPAAGYSKIGGMWVALSQVSGDSVALDS